MFDIVVCIGIVIIIIIIISSSIIVIIIIISSSSSSSSSIVIEDFECGDAGFSCDSSAARPLPGQDEFGLFACLCGQCGAWRHLPFDCREYFACGNVGLQCLGPEEQEKHENLCIACGRSQTCPFSMLDGFVCGQCNDGTAGPRFQEIPMPPWPQDHEESEDEPQARERKDAARRQNERTQLLWKVLLYKMPVGEASAVFVERGLKPPTDQELLDLQNSTGETAKKKAIGSRMAGRAALKSKRKKGPEKRWLNNELVTVAKKDRYIHLGGESAEDKAKTSVELYILGIGRGGRHACKIAREEKKKGPRS